MKRELAVAEFAEVVSGGTPSTADPKYWDGDVPWITPKDMSGHSGIHIEKGERSITESAIRDSSARLLPRDTVILSSRAPIGYVALSGKPLATNQGCKNLICRPDIAHPMFVYYLLKSSKDYLEAHATGSTYKELSASRLKRLRFHLPAIDIQQHIASILSQYDHLIENNRRRIRLLEESARLLYKEWFVHFRFPGHKHTSTCISNGVPDGWDRRTVSDVCTSFEDGDWIESKDQGGDDFRLIQISNIGNNQFIETGNFRYITSDTFTDLRCNEVVPGDVLISRMPSPIGRAYLVYEQDWRMITAVDVTIARTDPAIIDRLYYLYHLNSLSHLARCELRATGTTRPRISRKSMGMLPILRPPMRLQRLFGDIASRINEQRDALRRQSRALVQARDLLLPRLMTGESAR